MEIDIRTLALTLSLSFVIQAIALYLLSLVITKYEGMNNWAVGSIGIALGFVFIFLRSLDGFEQISILLANFSHYGGLYLIYRGSKKFLAVPGQSNILRLLFIFFMVFIAVFTYVYDHQSMRIIVYSVFTANIMFFNGWVYIRYGIKSIRRSSVFIASIFFLFTAFLLFRAVFTMLREPVNDFFSYSDKLQLITFIVPICFGLLWTFGLIVAVNQKINNDLTLKSSQLDLIFQTIPDAVLITEIDTGELINTNKGFYRLTGYNKEEVIGKSVLDINLWSNPNDRNDLIASLGEKGEMFNKVYSMVNKSGQEVPVLISVVTFNNNDKEYLLSVIRDISVMKEKEVEIALKNKALERLNAEKDKFFSILAHDLRSPFASMQSLAEVLSNKSFNFNIEQMQELAASIYQTAQTTNELLEDLLDWSGIRRGTKDFKPCHTTFESIMSHTLSGMKQLATNKQIELLNHIPGNTSVCADPFMLQSIMRNLISNAIKFTPHGGNIRLGLSLDDLNQQVFYVADSGIGMDQELIDSLFRIDMKNNRLGTDGESSSGLGLLLCKEFVDKHGGAIWVESQPRKGSTFYFTIG